MEQPVTVREPPRFCTPDEYFPLAEASDVKLEYRGGPMFPRGGMVVAMAGGSEMHGLIIGNVGGALWGRLRKSPCRYYSSDFRVGVRGYPTYTYTDGHVICGPTQLDERDPTGKTALNPRVVVEVQSPTTAGYDFHEKFVRYMAAESLQEYVLVAQKEPRVFVMFRQADGTWQLTPYQGLDAVARLRSIDVELPLSEVYLNVVFPTESGGATAGTPTAE